MAAEIEIDGEPYEIPPLDTFTIDEAQILYDYSKLTLFDFADDPDATQEEKEAQQKLFENPGFLKTLVHVAYQRKHPEAKQAKVAALVGGINWADARIGLADLDGEDDAVPPASTTEPEPSSPNGPVDSNRTSGPDSQNDSDQQANPPGPTGTGRSDTSSQESPPKLSVA